MLFIGIKGQKTAKVSKIVSTKIINNDKNP